MLPYLKEIPTRRELIDTFGGYNRRQRIADGEFFDMENLCGDGYPLLSTRRPRGTYAAPTMAQGMISKDRFCYVDGTDFVIGAEHYDMALTEDGAPKQMISMGAYVIILPDRKYINTADPDDRGEIEARVVTGGAVTFSLCRADASEYGKIPAQDSAPENPENMALWIDTGDTVHVLRQYSAVNDLWVSISTTYVKITSAGLGIPFCAGDGVTLSGIEGEALTALNGTHTVIDRGDDYLVVVGMLDATVKQSAPVSAVRQMPRMDFIIESENRLWGCRWGEDASGNMVNEIYASKLGDFKNWHCFEGISTDSYAVSVGSDGPFTGAITLNGAPLFFKEHCLHKIYGSYPAQYRLQTTVCRGVQRGCDRSLAIVGETLFYKSRSAVCAYDGSLPIEISAALGDTVYTDAAGGAVRNKYYVSMNDPDGAPHLFVYDTARRFWHREDGTRATLFCAHGGELYMMADGKILTVGGTGTPEDTSAIPWMAQSGLISAESTDHQYLTRLEFRLSMEEGAETDILIEYDSSGQWEHVGRMTAPQLRSVSLPIRLRRCDHLRIRLEGRGQAKIHAICRTLEDGGQAYGI